MVFRQSLANSRQLLRTVSSRSYSSTSITATSSSSSSRHLRTKRNVLNTRLLDGIPLQHPLHGLSSIRNEFAGLQQLQPRLHFSTSIQRLSEKEPKDDEKPVEEKPAEEEKIEKKEEVKEEAAATEVVAKERDGLKADETTKKASTKKSGGQGSKPSGASSADSAAGGGSGAVAGGGAAGGDGKDGGGGGASKWTKNLPQKPTVPDVYPTVMALPIARRPLFPGFYKAVTVRDPQVAAAMQEMIKRGQPYLGVFLFKDDNADADTISSPDEVHDVGVFAQITSVFPVQNEEASVTAVLYPHRRIRLSQLHNIKKEQIAADKAEKVEQKPAEVPSTESKTTATSGIEEDSPSSDTTVIEKPAEQPQQEQQSEKGDVVASFEEVTENTGEQAPKSYATSFLEKFAVSLVDVENVIDEKYDKKNPEIRAITSEIVNTFKDIANLNPLFRDQISTFSMSQMAGNIVDEPGRLADFAAAVSSGEVKELQEVLEATDIVKRLKNALHVLKKEQMNAALQSKISKDVESKIQKRQREYWLMEQMKGIRRELGVESDGKDRLVERFKERAAKLAMPEAVKKVFEDEMNKLQHLETAAIEFNVTRNYLDWLTQVPWGQQSAENYSIKHAQTVLDEDHYGLEDVKDRILEFIAVGKLRGGVEGKILCFVGPPGVGKTSIGKSIARSLQREFYRFSVGGLTDVAEIKGHRRTYVGALPGRVIQALKKCQTENPLILIDEVDKIGIGHQGDPSSALLELLDPEQNNSFLDHYMDVPVDLSKVLFVCTANDLNTIPRPLRDRMEIIRISGYTAYEKMSIAEKYLAPAAKRLSGLGTADVQLEKEAIEEIINKYSRESGVRNLKKKIEKVYRKVALKIVRDIGEEDALSEDKALTEEGKQVQKEAEEQIKKEEAKETSEPTIATDTPRAAEIPEAPKKSTEGPAPSTTAATPKEEKKEASGPATSSEKLRMPLDVPEDVHVIVNTKNLKDYLGPPIFLSDRLYETLPVGVSMGLAWTSMGGTTLYVESILSSPLTKDSSPNLTRTGNLQNVIKESMSITYSYVKGFMVKMFPENQFFQKANIHVHCPEGAVPKEGPSAGIAITSALLSLALDHAISPTIGMTGELTLSGKVLAIGGLREKVLAAKRSGATTVIFPKASLAQWEELSENVTEGIEGIPVEWYAEVYEILFKDLDKERAGKLWKKEMNGESKKEKKKKIKEAKEDEEPSSDDD